PVNAIKTQIHGTHDGLTQGILSTLTDERGDGALSRLLTESLLHWCLKMMGRHPRKSRKATRTYETICLYVQENFQANISRESVADHFGLAPNHVSRLFRHEGQTSFREYLNS